MVLSQDGAGQRHLPAGRGRVGTPGSRPELSRRAAIVSASKVRVVALFVVAKEELPEHDAMLCAGT